MVATAVLVARAKGHPIRWRWILAWGFLASAPTDLAGLVAFAVAFANVGVVKGDAAVDSVQVAFAAFVAGAVVVGDSDVAAVAAVDAAVDASVVDVVDVAAPDVGDVGCRESGSIRTQRSPRTLQKSRATSCPTNEIRQYSGAPARIYQLHPC